MKASIISLGVFQYSGGPTKTIGAFQSALNAETHCFCSSDEIKLHSLAIEGAQPVVSPPVPLLKQMRFATSSAVGNAESAFKESKIVSCHSFYRYHALWVNRMSRKHSVPYWFVPHGILDPWVLERGRFVKEAFWRFGGKRFLDEASSVIFSTFSERDKAASQFDLPASEVLPWPVELVATANRINCRDRIRRELSIPEEAKVLLYFGRIHSMKKPIETIRAVASGGDENLHLVIVGNEQDISLKECYNVADELGIAKQVHLIGPVYGDKKYDYLMAADAYISLSYRENFNHTAAESLSAGLPLILSPGNDLQGDIEAEQCSWGLRDDELKTASEAIEAFNCLSAHELHEMGKRGRAWVAKNLQFEQFERKIKDLVAKYGKG